MAKNRSATMPTKNGDIIAASAVVPYGEPDLLAGEVQRLAQPGAHRHVPGAPDEVLEEHHQREPKTGAERHGRTLKSRRHPTPVLPGRTGRHFADFDHRIPLVLELDVGRDVVLVLLQQLKAPA